MRRSGNVTVFVIALLMSGVGFAKDHGGGKSGSGMDGGLTQRADHRDARHADEKASVMGQEHANPNAGFSSSTSKQHPPKVKRDQKRLKRKAPMRANEEGISHSNDKAGLRTAP